MQVTKLEISNVLGIARADIDLRKAVTMIIGNNEAGKSSISDAISMAFIGEPRRVKLKKELGQLLHGDAKKGRVTLMNDDTAIAEYKLPSGDHLADAFQGSEFVPYIIDAGRFARESVDERRRMLFRLTGCKVNADATAARLLELGALPVLVDQIKGNLKAGFPSASKEAAEYATLAKGAFRGLTGQNWGAKQSAEWELEIPEGLSADEVTPLAIDKVIAKHAKVSKNVERGVEYMATMNQKIAYANDYYTRRDDLEAVASELPDASERLAAARVRLKASQENFDLLRDKLQEAQAGVVPVKCPCCEAELTIKGQTLEKFSGLKADTKNTSDLALKVTNARGSIASINTEIEGLVAAVTLAQNAATELATLNANPPEEVDLAQAKTYADGLQGQRLEADELRAQVNAMKERQNLLGSAEATNKNARKYHNEVISWLLIANALSPEGIPAEILATALKPVNDSLVQLCKLAGWKKVSISNDMDITADGRLYGLLSESAQWRADTLIALAIAQISGLKFVLLDRFDVLDMKGRGQLVTLLLELHDLDAINNAIICGTLKGLATDMDDDVQQIWIENGIAESA